MYEFSKCTSLVKEGGARVGKAVLLLEGPATELS